MLLVCLGSEFLRAGISPGHQDICPRGELLSAVDDARSVEGATVSNPGPPPRKVFNNKRSIPVAEGVEGPRVDQFQPEARLSGPSRKRRPRRGRHALPSAPDEYESRLSRTKSHLGTLIVGRAVHQGQAAAPDLPRGPPTCCRYERASMIGCSKGQI